MFRIAFAVFILFSSPVSAQQFMGSYFTSIGPQDHFNSSGTRLSEPCAMIQQDRANFHRFNKRDADDQSDPFFGDSAARAVIGQSCRLQHSSQAYLVDVLRRGGSAYLHVQVYGNNGRVDFVTFQEGAG